VYSVEANLIQYFTSKTAPRVFACSYVLKSYFLLSNHAD